MSAKKKFEIYSSSFIAIILVLCAIIALNAIISRFQLRLDVTEEKLYTISDGTKKILSKIETPINFRFYRSRAENRMPVQLASFADRVNSLLREYVKYSKGKITLEEFDPIPDSDSEDAAALDNIIGQPMPNGEKLYLGLAISYLDKTVSIPFFYPHEEATNEYRITSAIDEAIRVDLKKKIALLTELPIMTGSAMPTMRRSAQNSPWIIASELKKRFDVIQISPNDEKIPDGIEVLLLIHPKNLPEKILRAIDQHLMNGGKMLIALDSYCLTESRNSPQAMMGQPVPPGSSNLEKFLSKWGLEFTETKVVADINNSMRNINDPQSGLFPTVLDFRDMANNNSDPAINGIKHINMVYAGSFNGIPAEGLKLEKIVTASDNSALIESFLSEVGNDQMLKDFKKDRTEKILIAKLTGKFKTAFPENPDEKNSGKKQDENTEKQKENKENAEQKLNYPQESPETVVVLISDVDMFADEFSVQKHNLLGSTIIQPFNDNLILFQNIVEQLSGAPELLSIRSKTIKERPFTKIVEMLNTAQEKYQSEIQSLEKTREEVEAKINELQRGKTGSQQFILTKEQKEQIEKYRTEAALTAKKLKQTRKELRKDIDNLQMKIQIVNTAAMPLVLIAFGVAIWLNNRRRRSK